MPGMIDQADDVRRCLSCGKPECTNCLAAGNRNHRRGRPSKYEENVDRLRRFWAQGMTDGELSGLIGVPKSTVSQWRKRAGLSVNRGYWSAIRAMREAGA